MGSELPAEMPAPTVESQERQALEKPEGEWVMADVEYQNGISPENNGTYAENNGLIAYQAETGSGESGVVMAAPDSPERRADLEAKGYKPSSLAVPFSNNPDRMPPQGGEFERRQRQDWENKFGGK